MPCLDVQVHTADGDSNGTLHVPEGDGPWPGVLVFPDAGGVRETFRQMGGLLAVTGDPASPHLAAERTTAVVYVAGARDDGSFTAAQAALLESALTSAGVDHTIEFYPARHGFAVPDNPTYDASSSDRHRAALRDLYRARLQAA